MEPIHFLEVFAAIITLMDAARQAGAALVTPRVSEVREQTRNLEAISDADIQETIRLVVAIQGEDQAFLDRINELCLKDHLEKIRTLPDPDLDEHLEVERHCVCNAIHNARKLNGGRFPSDEFKQLWEKFRCGTI